MHSIDHFIKRNNFIDILFFSFWIILLLIFSVNVTHWEDGTFWVKGVAQWMDLPVHEAYIQHFINRPMSQWFSIHPLNIDENFTYHFLPDLISAGLYSAGLNISWSLSLPVLLCSIGFLYESYYFFKARHNAITSALIVSSVLLFGGIGFLYRLYNPQYFVDSFYETSLFSAPNRIFQSDFPNIFSDILFSQRGIPFGLWLFFYILRRYENFSIKGIAGNLTANAVMMLSMIHGSIALHFYLGFLFLLKPGKKLFLLILLLFIESVFIYTIFFKSSIDNHYTGFISGFYYGKQSLPWLRFWIASTFMLLPLSIFFTYKQKKFDESIIFAFFILLLINVVKFQPNMWDNIKLFFFALPFLYESIIVGLLSIQKTSYRYSATTIALLCLWGSGLSDVMEVTFTRRLDFPLYTNDDLILAEKLKMILPHDSTIIIENKHNHFALQLLPNHPLLGFQFNLDTYGHHYRQLKDHINSILEGREDDKFLKYRNVSAILIKKDALYGPRESKRVSTWNWNADDVTPNIDFMYQKYTLIAENKQYLVFSTTPKNDFNLRKQN